MDKIKIKKNRFNNINNKLVLPSLYLALVCNLILNPFSNKLNVTSFGRVMGNALMFGIDVSSVLRNIYLYICILIPLATIFLYIILSKIFSQSEDSIDNECLKLIDEISIIGFAPLIFSYLKRYTAYFEVQMDVLIPALLIISIIIYVFAFSKIFKFNILKYCSIGVIPIVILVVVILNRIGITVTQKKAALCYFIILWLACFVMNILNFHINNGALKKSYIIFMLSPIFMSIGIEFINIFSQHNTFMISKFKFTLLIYILMFILFVVVYLFSRNKNYNYDDKISSIYYITVLISLTFIWTQMPYQTLVSTDFFEQSNHGSAIYSFLENLQIPIIENFDAHMLSNSIGGIIYGLLNQDSLGAIFVSYSLSPIFIILFYFLLSNCFNAITSFLIMLFVPILTDYTYSLYGFGAIAIIATIYLHNNKSKKTYFLFWICLVMTCIFRLDIGMSFGISAIIVSLLMYMIKKQKDKSEFKKYFYSFILTAAICLVFYFIICLIKDINPVNRALEFINIANSNINWSYAYWGDTNQIVFAVCYIILPIIAVFLLIISTYKKIVKPDSISDSHYIIVMILGLAYILNLSRGIVRHSLAENIPYFVLSSVVLFISLYISFYSNKSKLQWFIFTEITLIIFVNLLMRPNLFETPSLISSSSTKLVDFSEYYDTGSKAKERVVISDSMKEIYLPLKTIFDELLDSNETYLDFTNQTLLYSMLNRYKPVYVNQSPGLLSGEFSQQQFIKEIENSKYNVTFVLMPKKDFVLSEQIDGIPNLYRYYLVSEYIGDNYTPIFSNDDFAVWCKNDLYNEKLNKLLDTVDQNVSSQYAADLKTYDFLYSNDAAELSYSENSLLMNTISVDPQLMGFERDIKVKRLLEDNSRIHISFDYESNVAGTCQLFYTTEENEIFSEEKSIKEDVFSVGELGFTIPCSAYTKIRLDIPENSKFIIKNIFYNNNNFPNVSLIDYSYFNIDRHTYNLYNIPFIWGNYDEIDYLDKKAQYAVTNDITIKANEPQCFNVDLNNIDKSEGNYFLLKVDSSQIGNMQVSLGNNDKGYIPKCIYNFTLKDIDNGLYILRVSSDFMWYSNEISAIQISSDINVGLRSADLIKGDTIKTSSRNNTYNESRVNVEPPLIIQAYNLSDNNWIRGVNSESDVILFSNNNYNRSRLNEATSIKSNNAIASVESVDIIDNWIHVTIKGDKEAFSYPNIIKVIK